MIKNKRFKAKMTEFYKLKKPLIILRFEVPKKVRHLLGALQLKAF